MSNIGKIKQKCCGVYFSDTGSDTVNEYSLTMECKNRSVRDGEKYRYMDEDEARVYNHQCEECHQKEDGVTKRHHKRVEAGVFDKPCPFDEFFDSIGVSYWKLK